jgi:copper chaperone CopZ
MTGTTKTHAIRIDGMSGDACVQKVTAALQGVQGVTEVSVTVGTATFTTEEQAKTQEARAAIVASGYKIADRLPPGEKMAAAPEAAKPVAATASTDGSRVIPKTPTEGGAQPALASNR